MEIDDELPRNYGGDWCMFAPENSHLFVFGDLCFSKVLCLAPCKIHPSPSNVQSSE